MKRLKCGANRTIVEHTTINKRFEFVLKYMIFSLKDNLGINFAFILLGSFWIPMELAQINPFTRYPKFIEMWIIDKVRKDT
jgi:hypothetical protein